MTERPISWLAAFLEEVPPLHTAEKAVSFDPVQMMFLQKLCREATLAKGVSVRKEDFFRAIVYVDYFTEVVAGRPTLLSDVEVVVEELERMHEYLDPDLELLVRYSGIYAVKDLKGDKLLAEPSLRQIAQRHARSDARARPT